MQLLRAAAAATSAAQQADTSARSNRKPRAGIRLRAKQSHAKPTLLRRKCRHFRNGGTTCSSTEQHARRNMRRCACKAPVVRRLIVSAQSGFWHFPMRKGGRVLQIPAWTVTIRRASQQSSASAIGPAAMKTWASVTVQGND